MPISQIYQKHFFLFFYMDYDFLFIIWVYIDLDGDDRIIMKFIFRYIVVLVLLVIAMLVETGLSRGFNYPIFPFDATLSNSVKDV